MKQIEVEYGQWRQAEDLVDRYLDRAGEGATCEVWFRDRHGLKLGYRAGNPGATFPLPPGANDLAPRAKPAARGARAPRTATPEAVSPAPPPAPVPAPPAAREVSVDDRPPDLWTADL